MPWIQKWRGWALFIDGDMIVRDDVKQLFAMRDDRAAAMVVKHDYLTRNPIKYLGTPMESKNVDYPRKQWSSVVLWNCAHYANRGLRPETVSKAETSYLHRFGWIDDDRLGSLPLTWGWLAEEYGENDNAKLIHYTCGVPAMKAYENCDHADEWHRKLLDTLNIDGTDPLLSVARARDHT